MEAMLKQEEIEFNGETERDPGLEELNAWFGRTDLTRENLTDIFSEPEAIKAVADMLSTGDPRYLGAIDVFREPYGSKIDEILGDQLQALNGNC